MQNHVQTAKRMAGGGGQYKPTLTLASPSKNFKLRLLSFFVVFLSVPDFIFASGLSNANSTLSTISDALMGVSVVTVTIAILVVGYKVLFGGQTIQECGKIIIGAVIIASASSLASLLVGSIG